MFPTPLQPAASGTVHLAPPPLQEPQAPAPAIGAGTMAKAKDFLLNAWNRTTTLHSQPSSEDLLMEEVASAKATLTLLRLEYFDTEDPDAQTQQLAQMKRLQSLLPERERTPLLAVPAPAQPLSILPASSPDAAPPAPATAQFLTSRASELGLSLANALIPSGAVVPVPDNRCVQPHPSASHETGPIALRGDAIFSDIPQANSDDGALARLVATVGAWCSSHVNMATEKLQRNIAIRENIRNTAQPDAYTKLEHHCNTRATRSTLGRLMGPSSGATIRTLLRSKDYDGNPNAGSYGPAHLAILSGHNKQLRTLLEESIGRIRVDQTSRIFEDTALGLATQCGNARGAELMLGHGATPKTSDFQWLAVRNDLGMFRMLHAHLKAPTHTAFGPASKGTIIDFQAVLGTAVVHGAVDVARFVLENGARLDPNDNVLLQFAAKNGLVEMVTLLLRHAPAGYAQRPDPVTQLSPLATAMRAMQVDTVAALMHTQPDPAFIAAAAASLEHVLPALSPFDREKIAPLRVLLRTPRSHAPVLALTGEAANDSHAPGAAATSAGSSKVSGRAFAFSDALSQRIAL